MTVRVFVDTNVLVYARDATVPDKQGRAAEWMTSLWQSRRGMLSVQVLSEFYAVVTRELAPPVAIEIARRDVRELMTWRPLALTTDVIEAAWSFQDTAKLSWWDALILAAAQVCACSHLLTEDLPDGQVIGGVHVIDPFRHPASSVIRG